MHWLQILFISYTLSAVAWAAADDEEDDDDDDEEEEDELDDATAVMVDLPRAADRDRREGVLPA